MTDRLFIALGALFGFWGVAAAAASAHVAGSGSLGTAANFLLFHGPLLVALPAVARAWVGHAGLLRAGGCFIALGVGLFSGDLALRALVGLPLFPMAAPTGGFTLMLGWAAIGASSLIRTRL
ncbi:DUF423 domain-containing protein [Chelatococcus sp. SYSU_G07232]|uniref:DUF423 domain-containing protein n=1 Tax=Chelatococcus albus TaxID=3047466 RepID=A0ABT7AE99_9HYPH|nr:DUF423 domain-containing protein [Chelatococcus sp. SYSU_G07232]MDJ1157692.1 DUF423 domain-containing protein [Chelatococcus sp. SYSU_G07232]